MTPRKVLICTYGTRGDVEPFLALAHGLKEAGFDVALATSSRFRAFVESHGVAFFPMSDTSLAALESPDGKTMLEGDSGLLPRITAGIRLSRRSGAIQDGLMRETFAAAIDFPPDLIVFNAKLFAAPHVAEKLGVPAFLGMLQPMLVPTAAFPAMGLPNLPLPGYNRFTYVLVRKSIGSFRRRMNRFRHEVLDLPPVRNGSAVLFPPGAGNIGVLHAYSSGVLPRPRDWPESARVTGYWRLDDGRGYTPPPDLAAFLDRGEPPVFIGFGSMPSGDARALARLAAAALRKAGRRGVIAKGWAGLDVEGSDDIIAIPPVPYAWLFPRMAAVVHHGGAGTTAEGLHAGVPCVICPFFGDQRGWAQLSAALGVGVAPLPRRRLTEDSLAAAIAEAVTNTLLRDNAENLAARLRRENGVKTAVEIITQTLSDPRRGETV
ncbi:glycosyltransferase [Martelella mediterranea]|uniref:Ecdysteroid UDP-glucosyltransferase n=1 Tax=Martelella mediterranea DSM 17316 TaxID=1122214 RepID=A0A1U9Z6Y7_9HYPH|nr:glycosyltransferase [Martelella mediterranea]AQZ53438.1 ecdysteroid UDP-glucosyltransferase [Martelella mediterranea DSM 17316]